MSEAVTTRTIVVSVSLSKDRSSVSAPEVRLMLNCVRAAKGLAPVSSYLTEPPTVSVSEADICNIIT